MLKNKKNNPYNFKTPEFCYGRGKILVNKNYTPGVKKKIKKFQISIFFFKFFQIFLFQKPWSEWNGRGKIPVKKNYTPGVIFFSLFFQFFF